MTELSEQETYHLITQIISGIRHRIFEEDALRGVLTEINRVTARWQGNTAPTTETDKVMFALNPTTTGWSIAGIDPSEVKTWEMIGFTPEYARQWHDANLDLTHALKWSNVYGLTSIDPAEIAEWETAGAGSDVNAASMWLSSDVPTERAISWTLAGGSYYNGRSWLNAYPEADPTKLRETEAQGLTLSKARPWIERDIVGDDIEAFMVKGYTPTTARKFLDGGGTAATAADLRGGAPIPGRSWKRIAAVIDGNPNITYSVTHHTGVVTCSFTHAKHDDTVDVTFHKNGQFSEASVSMKMQRHLINGQTHTWQSRRDCNLSELLAYLENWK